MNYVEYKEKERDMVMTAQQLINKLISDGHTAFIGAKYNCSLSDLNNALFLITFNGIVQATNPKNTWACNTNFVVHRFVDVRMTIVDEACAKN
jgi:hypothetical protein